MCTLLHYSCMIVVHQVEYIHAYVIYESLRKKFKKKLSVNAFWVLGLRTPLEVHVHIY